jgi:hypothetical protein
LRNVRASVFNTLSVILFFAMGYAVVFEKDVPAGGVLLLAAVVCAFVGHIDKVESFQASVSGVQAKIREADRVVVEAKSALTELHKFAEMASAMLINMLSGEGRLGGRSPREIEAERARILASLKFIGLADEAIKKVSLADEKWVAVDYSIGILHTLRKSTTCSPEQRQIATEMLERWNNEDYRPTPDEFVEKFKQHGVTDPVVLELVEDYKYYMKTGTHRRPNVWMDRRSWQH